MGATLATASGVTGRTVSLIGLLGGDGRIIASPDEDAP